VGEGRKRKRQGEERKGEGEDRLEVEKAWREKRVQPLEKLLKNLLFSILQGDNSELIGFLKAVRGV